MLMVRRSRSTVVSPSSPHRYFWNFAGTEYGNFELCPGISRELRFSPAILRQYQIELVGYQINDLPVLDELEAVVPNVFTCRFDNRNMEVIRYKNRAQPVEYVGIAGCLYVYTGVASIFRFVPLGFDGYQRRFG